MVGEGFVRKWVNGEPADAGRPPDPDAEKHTIEVVVDHLEVRDDLSVV